MCHLSGHFLWSIDPRSTPTRSGHVIEAIQIGLEAHHRRSGCIAIAVRPGLALPGKLLVPDDIRVVPCQFTGLRDLPAQG